MLIEQDDGIHIDIDEVTDLFHDEIMFDTNDPELVGKFVIVAVFKNLDTGYLTNLFENKEQAANWIDEIQLLQEFEMSLENYKF